MSVRTDSGIERAYSRGGRALGRMLGAIGTKAGGLARGWFAAAISVVWLIWVSLVAWRIGREIMDSGGTFLAGLYAVRASTKQFLLVAVGLSVALGVAMAKGGRTWWILPAVLTAAFFATLANGLAESDQGLEDTYDSVGNFIAFAVYLAVPVIAGAVLGAMWRRLTAGN